MAMKRGRSLTPYKRYGKKRRFSSGLNRADMLMARRARIARGPEMKYKDNVGSALTPVNLPSVATAVGLSNVAQGTTNQLRLGNKQTTKYLKVLVNIWHTSSVNPQSIHRVCVIQDLHNSDNVIPAVLDVFQTAAPNAVLNRDGASRFRILKDQIYSLHVNGPATCEFKYFLREKTMCNYDNTTSTSFTDGHYFLFVFGWDNTGISTSSSYTYQTRYTFTD